MDNTTPDGATNQLDPRTAERLLEQTRREADDALTPDSRALYVVWSVAWFIAMISAWLGLRSGGPFSEGVGMTLYFIAIGVAGVYTAFELFSKQQGIGGRSRVLGRWWGISWGIGWVSWALMMGGINRLAGSGNTEITTTLAPALATMVVGALYLQGGAFWPRSQMMLPGWLLLLVGGASTFAGPVNHYLVLGIGGALSFALAAWRTSGVDAREKAVVI